MDGVVITAPDGGGDVDVSAHYCRSFKCLGAGTLSIVTWEGTTAQTMTVEAGWEFSNAIKTVKSATDIDLWLYKR